ncbi:MAG: SMC-Scp complex subunit ScpB [Candidatus Azotimanducaceae bacterium]|nr:MAG: SMC-Scp complex subunit ScpB [Gammaproteobacteria bacterium TMED133]
MNDLSSLRQIIEGAILAADCPLNLDKIIGLFDGEQPTRTQILEALEQIEESCSGRGFELKQVASGYRFQVRQEYSEWVSRLWDEKPQRYSRALLETLALIAYKQPITRGDIENVRGVAVSTNIMRTLIEREWVRVVGYRDVPGRPATYATTKNFLDYFNLSGLGELPDLSEADEVGKVNEELDFSELVEEANHNEQGTALAAETATKQTLEEASAEARAIDYNIHSLFPVDGYTQSGRDDEKEQVERDNDAVLDNDIKTSPLPQVSEKSSSNADVFSIDDLDRED